MDIFGVGPGELILVLIIALVVVGPERLPVLARQAGKFLVSARNWVQKSPDAAMVLRARQEIEAELANIRESLAEVQSARDEVVQAAKQVNTLVQDDVIGATRQSIAEVTQTNSIPRATKPNGLPANPPPVAKPEATTPEPQLIAPDGSTLIEAADTEPALGDTTPTLTGDAAIPQAASSDNAPTPQTVPGDLTVLHAQIAALASELRQLQATLQERGVIDPMPLVPGVHEPFAPLRVPDLSALDPALSPTREEPADVEQPVYSRD